jgi:16S rRNA (adenine1518-N6/adenine1519-N6)-dimethyltransferase
VTSLPPPRRSLGQVFLNSERVINRIVSSLDLSLEDTVIEIGPGRGALTNNLIGACGRLVLVEKDDVLAAFHKERFTDDPSVEVIHSDATVWNCCEVLKDGQKAKVIGNLPYNVGGQILFNLMQHQGCLTKLVLMFQREVAQRLVAQPGDRNFGAVSALIQTRADVRMLFEVSPTKFKPVPKVWSAVVEVVPKVLSPEMAAMVNDPDFSKIAHGLFAQPRKTCLNSLADGLKTKKAQCQAWLIDAGIDPQTRPANVDISAITDLYRLIKADLGHKDGQPL